MSFMYESFGGIALWKANEALEILLDDPQQLERARSRFSRTPPTYRSYPSGTTTQLPSAPNEEEQWLSDRRRQLSEKYRASLCHRQFEIQVFEEVNRYDEDDDEIHKVPIGVDYTTYARECIKKRWIEQGIWNKKWRWGGGTWGGPAWKWKHEEPLEPAPELQPVSETETKCPFYSPFPWIMRSEPETAEEENSEADDSEEDGSDEEDREEEHKEAKDDEETQRIRKARDLREREREASRPFYQFVYQLSKEREKIQQRSRRNGESITDPDDISTIAYEATKNIWIKRGIWDEKWGIMPGMSWRHEQQPLEEWLEQQMRGITYPGPRTPPSPFTFNETNLTDFRSVPSSPAEQNQEAVLTNLDHSVPMDIDVPEILDAAHNNTAINTSRHTSPPPPSKEKRPRGRPRKAVVKPPQDLPTPESPISLRRSKRLQEAKATIMASDTVAEHRGRGRPKRGGTNAEVSAHGAPTRDSRALKRRALKQKKALR
ncbi:hypothetical protein F4860DRAFT_524735 [Xylaria cubensis]|nr:hypothetical protein F4860DRAFT_524735 [Xylaria cubensis]